MLQAPTSCFVMKSTVAGSLVMRGMRIAVPLSLRERVLELAH